MWACKDAAQRFALLLFLLPGALGCTKEGNSPQDHASPSSVAAARPPEALVTRTLASPSAFDLVPTPFGASLAWVAGDRAQRELFVLDLGRRGEPGRKAFALTSVSSTGAEVSDLSYAFVTLDRAMVWVERLDDEPRAVAAFRSESGETKSFDLGVAHRAPPMARGNVALGVRRDGLVVFLRGKPERCVTTSETDCHGFRFHRFDGEQESSTSTTLSVPVPCDEAAARLVDTSPRWHYAVCTEVDGGPVLTVFSIQPDPEYASAEQFLHGCRPLGTVVTEERGAIIARCRTEHKLLHLFASDHDPHVELLRPSEPRCVDGRLRLRAGSWEVDTSKLRGDLRLLLPRDVAPADARAAWAGESLVIASAKGGELWLRRLRCDGQKLLPAEPPDLEAAGL